MKNFSELINGMKQSRLHNIVLLVLILVSITSYIFYTDIRDTKATKDVSTSELNTLEFSIIESTLKDEVYKGSIQADLLSELITKDILAAYTDKNALRWDLTHISPAYKLYDIINSNISTRYLNDNNVFNRVFAVSNGNVISASFTFTGAFDKGESVYKFLNKPDNDESINKVIKEKQNFSVVNITGESPVCINSIRDLKSIYDEKGLGGLKDYFLLVPSYITKDGDILGVPDTNAIGEIQNNNKIIIVQVISCYDAISSQANIMDSFNRTYNTLQVSNDYDLRLAYLRNYMMLAIIVGLSLISVYRYHKRSEN